MISKEELEKAYLVDELSIKEIENKFNISAGWFYPLKRKYGIISNRKKLDLIGKTFNYLTVIEEVEVYENNPKKETYYKCLCKCGNYKVVKAVKLKSEEIKSCGCFKKGNQGKTYKGIGLLSGSFWSRIKKNAKKRKIRLELTINEAYEKFNGFCYISGLPISFIDKTASLDRIDSKRHYQIDNIGWVHKYINTIKWTYSINELLYNSWRIVQKIKDKPLNLYDYWTTYKFKTFRCNTRKRNIDLLFDKNHINDIFIKQNCLCNITGVYLDGETYIPSIDRIDSDLPYDVGNIQILEATCNRSKHKFSTNEYLYYMEKIYEYNKLGDKIT